MIQELQLSIYDKIMNCVNWLIHLSIEENGGLLAGVSAFEVGIDGFCEGSCHWQSILRSHGKRAGSSGAT